MTPAAALHLVGSDAGTWDFRHLEVGEVVVLNQMQNSSQHGFAMDLRNLPVSNIG
jgi:hypothetical protein